MDGVHGMVKPNTAFSLHRFGWLAVFCLFLIGWVPAVQARQSQPILRVAAAADLSKAFKEVADAYQRETGQLVKLTFGATGQLTQQIEHGAPFDVFAAANESYIADLDKQDLLLPDTRQVYAIGRLALWTRKGGPPCPRSLADLTQPRYAHIAIANPKVAPYGKAAQEALEAARLWDTLQSRLVYGENIQQTLQFAQSGNADVALISLSLAKDSGGSTVLVPEKLYTPLRQALAVVKSTSQPEAARRFAAFVAGPKGRAILKKYNFALPETPKPSRRAASEPPHRS